MRRMSIVLACLSLLAFRSGERPYARRVLPAGPQIAPSLALAELETPARHFPRRPLERRSNVWEERSNVAKLLTPILDAHVVPGSGQAMANLLAQLPEERRALGVGGLTTEQLSRVCESPQVDFEVEHDGERFELRYDIDPLFFMTEPQPSLYALTSTCTGALRASNGTLSDAIGAGCTLEDEEAHFPTGSRCRTCLEVDGDHDRCVAAGECKEEMTRELFAKGAYWDLLDAATLACAPNYFTDVVILANELGEDNIAPQPFDHAAIGNLCYWFWKAGPEEQRLVCSGEIAPAQAPAIGDLVVGRVVHIRRPGSTATPHAGRLYFASGIDVEGVPLRAIALSPETLGPISNPDRENGFGWNPQFLRPDGTDPTNLNHTYARDWIGTVTVKTATQITGVPVSYRNRNLCSGDQWQGPDDKGRYYCKEPYYGELEPPDVDSWAYDWSAFYYSVDPPDLELRPMMTLAATGMMDPAIPGGHVSKIYGSTQLADPDWENCTWPDMFEPDEMLTHGNNDEVYTHTSQTYRFDKTPDRNIRITLSSSWRRAFCPGALE